MNTRLRAVVLRAGAATALAVGLVAAAGPAYAADGPDVRVAPHSTQLAKGVKEAKAKPFQVELENFGNADATSVSVKLDLSGLTGKVGYVTPKGCEKTGRAQFACPIGDIAAGQDVVLGIPLFNANGRKGNGGSFSVTAIVPGDTDEENNSEVVNVTVVPKTYDLTVWAQDIYSEVVSDGDDAGEETRTPVPPGGTAPFDSAIFNHGSKRVVGVGYSVKLPDGVSFASTPETCIAWEDVNGIICADEDVVLRPGEVLLPEITVKVADDATAGVFPGGVIDALALEPGATDAEQSGDEARMATESQKKAIADDDSGDNSATFDVFVGAAPTDEPTTPPGGPGEGGGGGLPVTGPAAGIIGGVGGAVILAGVALFFFARRRRIVTVTPDA